MRSNKFIIIFFLFFCSFFQVTSQNRPNILFILSDDQRADAIGAYGNPYIQTPNLDRLAALGTKFTNNFCMGSEVSAVCRPSRAMLMSGRSLFHINPQLTDIKTMPQVLAENGYVTFGTGKWHNGENSFEKSFQYGKNIFFGGMSDHFKVPVVDLRSTGGFSAINEEGFSTKIFTNAALDFIDRYVANAENKPFFMFVSYTAPHDPRSPDPDYIDYYEPSTLPLPPDFEVQHYFNLGEIRRDEDLGAWPRTPKQIRMQLADYYGLITQMDHEIGRILDRLQSSELLENTLVIFSSDHGLSIGSHGLLGKQNLYEPSMKAPLIIKGPAIPANETRQALVYLYDIFPTVCDYLKIATPDSVDGISFLPVIKGSIQATRNSLFTAYKNFHRAVRDHRWKLIRYPLLDYNQLFDLKNDPFELNNLTKKAKFQDKEEEMMTLLKEWQNKTDDRLPLTTSESIPFEFDVSNHKRIPDKHQPEYVLRKYFNE